MNYQDILDAFISYHRIMCHTEKTIKNYIDLLNTFDNVVEPEDYCKLTFKDINKYQQYIANKNLSSASVGSYFRHLKAFLRWLEEYDYSETKGLYNKIKIPKMPKKNVKIYTDEEIRLIYKAIETESDWLTLRNKLIISFMLDCGLRQNEVCGVYLWDLDFVRCTLNVHGKGNKDRLVPIGNITMECLHKYLAICPYKNDFLLCNRRGKKLTCNSVKLFASKLQKKLGFEFSSHKLRHNFATNYLLDSYYQNGMYDTYSLMILLGHENIKTTDRYVHYVQQQIATNRKISHLDKVLENI